MLLPNRRADLLVKDLGDEVLAFDRSADRVLHLEGTTAAVWRACDGTTSVGDCALSLGIAEDEVLAALRELDDKSLVKLDGLSRRRLLIGAGTVAAVTPILAMIAPTAAAAQSLPLPGGGGSVPLPSVSPTLPTGGGTGGGGVIPTAVPTIP